MNPFLLLLSLCGIFSFNALISKTSEELQSLSGTPTVGKSISENFMAHAISSKEGNCPTIHQFQSQEATYSSSLAPYFWDEKNLVMWQDLWNMELAITVNSNPYKYIENSKKMKQNIWKHHQQNLPVEVSQPSHASHLAWHDIQATPLHVYGEAYGDCMSFVNLAQHLLVAGFKSREAIQALSESAWLTSSWHSTLHPSEKVKGFESIHHYIFGSCSVGNSFNLEKLVLEDPFVGVEVKHKDTISDMIAKNMYFATPKLIMMANSFHEIISGCLNESWNGTDSLAHMNSWKTLKEKLPHITPHSKAFINKIGKMLTVASLALEKNSDSKKLLLEILDSLFQDLGKKNTVAGFEKKMMDAVMYVHLVQQLSYVLSKVLKGSFPEGRKGSRYPETHCFQFFKYCLASVSAQTGSKKHSNKYSDLEKIMPLEFGRQYKMYLLSSDPQKDAKQEQATLIKKPDEIRISKKQKLPLNRTPSTANVRVQGWEQIDLGAGITPSLPAHNQDAFPELHINFKKKMAAKDINSLQEVLAGMNENGATSSKSAEFEKILTPRPGASNGQEGMNVGQSKSLDTNEKYIGMSKYKSNFENLPLQGSEHQKLVLPESSSSHLSTSPSSLFHNLGCVNVQVLGNTIRLFGRIIQAQPSQTDLEL
ncbi:hypothetical protein CROQUDRAFT_134443 [Cronartium quercuum f. sp. fusiforme G11]|uniref:Uncharacterized protein n=1 Tax=Cronartium quercuum f. sp. fusiforme G11 TaxID=708437 RepID=A0A9P6T9L1_9BASI|nr:hypothetical protein CROQUDRAFT_134443 [Cronartium quercuum f. sp. fusiforme G11]